MWYKDKCSRLMELKPTLLFPCCASLTHVRLVSLIKENKCFRHPLCKSIKFVCVCLRTSVCVCVCGKLSQLFSLSIISPSLHNGFSLALNGREYKLQLTLNSRAFALLTEPWTCDYIKQRGKTIDYLINIQLMLMKKAGSQLHSAAVLLCWGVTLLYPQAILYDASKPLKESNLNYARRGKKGKVKEKSEREKLFPFYVHGRHLAVHLNFRELVLTLYLDSTGVD